MTRSRFRKLIDEYNAGSKNIEQLFAELIRFAQSRNEEDKRAVSEGLTEEELALFDILTKPDPKLTKAQEAEVKRVVKELLEILKAGSRLALTPAVAGSGAPVDRDRAGQAARGLHAGHFRCEVRPSLPPRL